MRASYADVRRLDAHSDPDGSIAGHNAGPGEDPKADPDRSIDAGNGNAGCADSNAQPQAPALLCRRALQGVAGEDDSTRLKRTGRAAQRDPVGVDLDRGRVGVEDPLCVGGLRSAEMQPRVPGRTLSARPANSSRDLADRRIQSAFSPIVQVRSEGMEVGHHHSARRTPLPFAIDLDVRPIPVRSYTATVTSCDPVETGAAGTETNVDLRVRRREPSRSI